MPARISDQLTDTYSSDYHSLGFQNTMEYHIPIIRNLKTSTVLEVSGSAALQYDGDLFGLLNASALPSKYHWVTMRCNGLRSPMEYRKSMVQLMIPDFDYIDDQFSIYRTTNNI